MANMSEALNSSAAEVNALTANAHLICGAIPTVSSITWFSQKLEGDFLITSQAKMEIMSSSGRSDYEKCDQLLSAVKIQVQADRSKFSKFLNILKSEVALQSYADSLYASLNHHSEMGKHYSSQQSPSLDEEQSIPHQEQHSLTVTAPQCPENNSSMASPITASVSSTAIIGGMSLDDVCVTIEQLKDQFEIMRNATEEALGNAGISVNEVAKALMSIPAAKRKSHEHLKLFLRESNKDFFKSESVPELFGLVELHWSYLEYHLLEHLIKRFSLKCLHPQMESYKRQLQNFMKKTPLTLYWEADEDEMSSYMRSEFTTMVTKHKWPPTITLMDVEDFRGIFVSKYCLHECAMMLKAAKPGSIHITWIIPQSVVDYLIEEIQSTEAEFFQQNGIIQLVLDGQCIYSLQHTEEDIPQGEELIAASEVGDVFTLVSLLQAGVDPNTKGNHQKTALHHASVDGHLPVVLALLNAGADVRAQDMFPRTSLHWASSHGHLTVVQALLDAGADVKAQDENQKTSLHHAIDANHLAVAETLLNAGVDVKAQVVAKKLLKSTTEKETFYNILVGSKD